MGIVRIKALDGSPVEFEDKLIGAGGMKDVYFSPDRSYVVGFFRTKQDYNAKDRLEKIAGPYREKIFSEAGGDYWKELFCWPTKVVEHNGLLGVVAPTYQPWFFFEYGSANNDMFGIKGNEKDGKWFASASHLGYSLDPRERGDWLQYLKICILITRATRRMHAAGLAHSDLSYKNVLIDPMKGHACLIDLDSLVVPGKYPPDVLGTPDFIAPEVLMTNSLPPGDPRKALPRRETDQHALAVLIYMYLLHRHPLRGRKVHDLNDSARDEMLGMGERALFVESQVDRSNRYDMKWLQVNHGKNLSRYLPWEDLDQVSYTTCGPYLKALFDRSFTDGLHNPALRPSANDYETALVQTADLILPCSNPQCPQKWFVFDNTKKPVCPYCRTAYKGTLPVINFYSSRGSNSNYVPDNQRLMVYNNQYLYPWHVFRTVFPNEKLAPEQKKPVGYFVFHQGQWLLINQTLTGMRDLIANKAIGRNESVVLKDGAQILLSPEPGGRVISVQLVNV